MGSAPADAEQPGPRQGHRRIVVGHRAQETPDESGFDPARCRYSASVMSVVAGTYRTAFATSRRVCSGGACSDAKTRRALGERIEPLRQPDPQSVHRPRRAARSSAQTISAGGFPGSSSAPHERRNARERRRGPVARRARAGRNEVSDSSCTRTVTCTGCVGSAPALRCGTVSAGKFRAAAVAWKALPRGPAHDAAAQQMQCRWSTVARRERPV